MARTLRNTEVNVTLNGHDISWIFQLGEYAIEEQIEIRDLFAKAENVPFVRAILQKISAVVINLTALDEHWNYMHSNHPDFEDMARIEQEIRSYRGGAFLNLDNLLNELSERLAQKDDVVMDSRSLQARLRLAFG